MSDPREIINDTISTINELKNAKTEMSSSAIVFTKIYDNYFFSAKRDGTLLKEKMKLAVIKGSNDYENNV